METHHLRKVLYPLLVMGILIGCNRSPSGKDGVTESETEVSLQDKAAPVNDLIAAEEMRQAALNRDGVKVKKLLEAGTNANALDQDGQTALMFAAFNGHSEIVMALLDKGAVLDRRDLLGRTALLYASTGPFPETVKLLLDNGAKPNIVDSDEHFTPLMHAAAEGNLDVVKLLMKYEADPSLTDVDGDDAESFARQAGHIQVADYLHSVR